VPLPTCARVNSTAARTGALANQRARDIWSELHFIFLSKSPRGWSIDLVAEGQAIDFRGTHGAPPLPPTIAQGSSIVDPVHSAYLAAI
jgi:hypothetical protein